MAYVVVPSATISQTQTLCSPSHSSSKLNYHGKSTSTISLSSANHTNPASIGLYSKGQSASFYSNGLPSSYRSKQVGSSWRNALRTSRRYSRSVDANPFLTNHTTYSCSSNYDSKYFGGLKTRRRTVSPPDISTQIRNFYSRNRNNECSYRLRYGAQQHCMASESSSNSHILPQNHEPTYAKKLTQRHCLNLNRNVSDDLLLKTERRKDMKNDSLQNSELDISNLMSDSRKKYSSDDLEKNTDIQKGDVIKNQFHMLQEIGRGSFGQVFKAMDSHTGKLCAVKCIKNISNFKKLAEEEISVLLFLMQQDKNNDYNFLHLRDHFSTDKYTFMIFDLLSVNLYQLIYRNNFRGFAPLLVRKFVRGILNCLQFLHKNQIIHCDLKPENVLLEHPGYTKVMVIDFGSSCFVGQNVYAYIQSRFYRAPEVMFGSKYGTPIDIWSLGCITAELLTGTPLFPGEDEQDQVACIMEVLGLPCSSVMRKIRRLHHFFTDSGEPRYLAERAEQHQTKINGNNRPRRMCRADPGALSLEVLLKSSLGDDGCDPMLTDFIARCIRWDPMKRLTALEGLQHPWVTNGDVSDHDKIKESPQPGGTQPSEGSAISSSLEE